MPLFGKDFGLLRFYDASSLAAINQTMRSFKERIWRNSIHEKYRAPLVTVALYIHTSTYNREGSRDTVRLPMVYTPLIEGS
jgi:hypothetical protein